MPDERKNELPFNLIEVPAKVIFSHSYKSIPLLFFLSKKLGNLLYEFFFNCLHKHQSFTGHMRGK